jgi:hypothetical protein
VVTRGTETDAFPWGVQLPNAFQFNEELLLFLSQHQYSGWFGNFLFDSEKERSVRPTHTDTHCRGRRRLDTSCGERGGRVSRCWEEASIAAEHNAPGRLSRGAGG